MAADTTPRRGRPPRLSVEEIVAAARRFDLDRLSMHELARTLGVAHSALYRWVGSREALADLVADSIVVAVTPAAPPADGDWRGWLGELGRTMRREFLAVPGSARRLVRPHRHSAAYDRLLETVVAAFAAGGVEREQAVQSWYAFATSIIGWLAIEQGRERPLEPAPDFEALLDVLLRGLPAR